MSGRRTYGPGAQVTPAASTVNDGTRASSSSNATRAIIRAAALPMQWWLPG